MVNCKVPVSRGLSDRLYFRVNKEKEDKSLTLKEREDLWDKFYMHAQRLRTPSELQYNNRKKVSAR